MRKIFATLMLGAAFLSTATPSLADGPSTISVATSGDVAKAKLRHRGRRNHAKADHDLAECDPLALTLEPCRPREPQLDECDPLALTLKPCR